MTGGYRYPQSVHPDHQVIDCLGLLFGNTGKVFAVHPVGPAIQAVHFLPRRTDKIQAFVHGIDYIDRDVIESHHYRRHARGGLFRQLFRQQHIYDVPRRRDVVF